MIVRFNRSRRLDMLVRSHDLEDRISDTRQSEIFTLPIEAARCKAREIIYQSPQSGFIPIIENWRQRPDGQIEFICRRATETDSERAWLGDGARVYAKSVLARSVDATSPPPAHQCHGCGRC